MKIWKSQEKGLMEINGNSAMIDTEGIKSGGGIYQISLLIFNDNGDRINQCSWYISENIDAQIEMHKDRKHNENKGVYKKLLKIRKQKNSNTNAEQVQKSIIRLLQKYDVKNILGQSIYYHDLPLLRDLFKVKHLTSIFGKISYYDTRIHYQRAVNYNEKYKNYTVKKNRYTVNELSKHFLNTKEKHTATNDCKKQLELLKLLEIA